MEEFRLVLYKHSKTLQNLCDRCTWCSQTFITGKCFFLLPCEMAEPWWIGFFMYLFTDRCMQSWNAASIFFIGYSLWGGKISGWVLNLTGHSGRIISGTGFSLKPVQTSTIICYLLSAYLRSRSTFCIFNLLNQPMSLSSLINSPEIGLCKLLHVKLLICERGEVHISDCGKHFA